MSRLEPILSPNEVQALLDVAKPTGARGIALNAEPVDLLADDRHLRLLLPGLKVGYARAAERLRRVLTSVLRAKVELRDEEPELLTGRGLLSVAEQAACLLVLRMTSKDHDPVHGVLAMDPTFTFAVIERLFGGGGSTPKTPEGRSPTALERRMLLKALEPMFDVLNEALEPPGFLTLVPDRIESRLDLVPGYTPDMTVVHVPFTMTIGDELASVSLATPATALEPLRGRLGVPKAETSGAGAMGKIVRSVGIRLSVELGRVQLTMRQILELRPGTVLALDTNRSAELPIQLEGVTKFVGVPVQDDGAIAIEITGSSK